MKRRTILFGGVAMYALLTILTCSAHAQWPQLAKATASDGNAYDYFGTSVSLYGDYALVGVPGDDSGRGSAYIFKWDGTAWTQLAKLTAADGASGDGFGYSVSLYGDYALVGAVYDSGGGSAYIFTGGGEWGDFKQAKLTASDSVAYFGYSVSIYGDYALVGASNSSSAYIFKLDRSNGEWPQQAKLTISGSGVYVWSVSLYGDYALVGATDARGFYGRVDIFKRDGTTWNQQAHLELPGNENTEDLFGYAVSIYGDYALVGAPWADMAYVFKRDGTIWNQQAILVTAVGNFGGNFGWSVSLCGDYALVGAFNANMACVFKREGTLWPVRTQLTSADAAANDNFGWSVSLYGDYALVGARWDDDMGTDSGSAYLFGKCPDLDVTGDCFVDFQDFAVMADQWLTGYK